MNLLRCKVLGRPADDTWINPDNVILIQKNGQGYSVLFVNGDTHQFSDLPVELFAKK